MIDTHYSNVKKATIIVFPFYYRGGASGHGTRRRHGTRRWRLSCLVKLGYALVILKRGLYRADEGGQVVEAVALVAGDGVTVAVVGPGGDKQHLATGTGIEHLAAGFPIRGEAVLEQLDEREACCLDHVHHGFFAGADAGRHEHSATLRHLQETCDGVFFFLFGHVAMALLGHLVGAVEQEAVAHNGDVLATNEDVLLCFEELWMIALGPQAARVVIQVLEHGIELALALQDAVVVALLPERGQGQFPGDPVAPDLEAVDHVAQVAREPFGDLNDGVQVIWHESQGEQPDLGVESRYLAPAGGDAFP